MVHDSRADDVIRGWAETLLEGDVPPKEAAERARAIMEAVDRLDRMTGETLDFARGAESLVLRAVPLRLLVAELAAGIEQELPGLAVERDVELPSGRRGRVDVDKLRRAVTNIAANARDAMGGQGRIRFRARIEPFGGSEGAREHLVLVLADDGPGVAPGIRDRCSSPSSRTARSAARASDSRWPGASSRITAGGSISCPSPSPRAPCAERASGSRFHCRRPIPRSGHARIEGMRGVRRVALLLAAAAASGCRSHDPGAELRVSDCNVPDRRQPEAGPELRRPVGHKNVEEPLTAVQARARFPSDRGRGGARSRSRCAPITIRSRRDATRW